MLPNRTGEGFCVKMQQQARRNIFVMLQVLVTNQFIVLNSLLDFVVIWIHTVDNN
jgi:hypothetical protein